MRISAAAFFGPRHDHGVDCGSVAWPSSSCSTYPLAIFPAAAETFEKFMEINNSNFLLFVAR